MKYIKQMVAVFVATFFAMQVNGQLLGLPIAGDAAPKSSGSFGLSGGLVLGDDVNFYGARVSFSAMDELLLFGDVGIVDPDGLDSEPGIQAGGQFSLPSVDGLPVDLALRAAIGYANFDENFPGGKVELDLWTFSAGLVASKKLDDMFTGYGFLGISHTRAEVESRAGGVRVSDDDNETDPALGAGVLVSLTEQISAYLELVHIDDFWFGAGLRLDL